MTTDIKERKRCIMMTGFLAVLWAAAAGRCAMIFLCGHIKLHKRDAKARGHVQHCPEGPETKGDECTLGMDYA